MAESHSRLNVVEKTMKPFLKWAGGKSRLVERISSGLPHGSRLVEPFAGSAAVSLGTNFPNYLVADVNNDLISLYNTVKYREDELVEKIEELFVPQNNEQSAFGRLRDEFNATAEEVRKAALFVYLNRHCFNGLCRYNSRGKFNVPFGRYKEPKAPIREIRFFAQRAARMEFVCADFRDVLAKAEIGDVVYCDPPYVPLTATANFTAYSAGDFSMQDQRDLALEAERLANGGITVVISNHDTEFTRDIYRNAEITAFSVQRFISRDATNRVPAQEVLAIFPAVGVRRASGF